MDQKQLSSAIDAVKTAIMTEMQGYELYKGAAERTTDPEARRMFQLLADEEESHSRMLHEQFKSLMQAQVFTAPPKVEEGEGFETLVADPKWRKSLRFGNMELSAVSIGVEPRGARHRLLPEVRRDDAGSRGAQGLRVAGALGGRPPEVDADASRTS